MPQFVIEVPPGHKVQVVPIGAATTGGARQGQPDTRPPQIPDEPECPAHGVPWKLIPAGWSDKKQKFYGAFYACPEKFCTERPTFNRHEDEFSDVPF